MFKMSWQEVSFYRRHVHTGECGAAPIHIVTSELNGSEIDLTQKRSECERSSTNWDQSEIDLSQKQINRVVCCVGTVKIKAIGMWTLECRQNWDRSRQVTLFQRKQISWIDLRTIQVGSRSIHISELDQSEIDLNVNAQMWTEIDLNCNWLPLSQMWTDIDPNCSWEHFIKANRHRYEMDRSFGL